MQRKCNKANIIRSLNVNGEEIIDDCQIAESLD